MRLCDTVAVLECGTITWAAIEALAKLECSL